MGVEDKWHKNRIFHQSIHLTINDMHSQRWKMEDQNVFLYERKAGEMKEPCRPIKQNVFFIHLQRLS